MTSRSTEAMTTWLGTLARVGIVDTQTMLAGQALMAYVVGEEKLDALRSWFALCTPETAALEKQAAIEMCVWMAHADREIVANELEILAELVRQSGLSQAAQAAILGAISHPPSLMGLERRITHPVLRELMLALTWELACADGRIDAREREVFERLARTLDISRVRALEILDTVTAHV
ncbi:MAG: tellurite resistance TerB family protein [Sandaracinaceae bacterium]|nr:tellurite resistance TerB family protein [Sandaracinaceae bacterium]